MVVADSKVALAAGGAKDTGPGIVISIAGGLEITCSYAPEGCLVRVSTRIPGTIIAATRYKARNTRNAG